MTDFFFFPGTQAPGTVSLSERGTPSESGYLKSDGTVLSYINAAGTTKALTTDLATAESDIAALESDIAALEVVDAAVIAEVNALQLHRLHLVTTAKNPAAVGLLASGMLVPGAATVDSVRLGAGTLPTGATDAFSFNLRTAAGNLFATAQVWAREVDVAAFGKTVNAEVAYTSQLTEVTGTGTANVAIDTLANGDAFYAGFSDIFAGVRIDLDGANVNAAASVLAAHYWDGSAWVALTVTDGTDAAGATLAQDGAVTWLMPSDWATKTITTLHASAKYYVRFTVSVALTAGTAIDNADIIRATNHGYAFTPDQNATLALGAELRLHCTEADANAAGLFLQVAGSYT